jgi:HPt (histidine-containing phosphotransfer) domain-containing protein
MPEGDGSLRAELQKLREEYAAQLGSRLQCIEDAASALREAWDSDKVESLYQQVHRLSGSAAIYGFEAVSRAAQALETALLDSMERRPGARRRLRDELARLLNGLHGAAAREGQG